MSIDVFGRTLGAAETNRGPPGIGYKITEENQYDLENKRLCNVGTATHPNDAVNLKTLHDILSVEIKNIYDSLSKMKTDLKELDRIMDIHREELDMKFIGVYSDINKLKSSTSED